MAKRLICAYCIREARTNNRSAGTSGSPNGICGEHRAQRAQEPCKSGADCGNLGGHGLWGGLCADCTAVLNSLGKTPGKWNGREPEAPKRTKRVPREETAAKVAAVVRQAGGPITTVVICEALGTTKGNNSVRRAVEYAKEQRWIALDNGRGFVAGEVEPPGSMKLSRNDAAEPASHGEAGSTSELPATSMAA